MKEIPFIFLVLNHFLLLPEQSLIGLFPIVLQLDSFMAKGEGNLLVALRMLTTIEHQGHKFPGRLHDARSLKSS